MKTTPDQFDGAVGDRAASPPGRRESSIARLTRAEKFQRAAVAYRVFPG
jgi:hypothetical protein